MKRMLWGFCAICLLLSVSQLSSCKLSGGERAADGAPHVLTYLVVGFDEAASNTDVMLLLAFDTQTPSITAIQLPRDTYVNTGRAQNKINQVFSSERALGGTTQQALVAVKNTVETVLGVHTDAVVGISLPAFRKTVDLVGGVPVNLPEEIVLDAIDEGETPLILSAGENLLDGQTACRMVRHRSSYASGDLGRIDAQKIFLSAFFRTVRERIGVTELLSLCDILQTEYVSDTPFLTLAATALNYYPLLRRSRIRFATLPGEAALSDTGLSYYVVNRAAVCELLASTFGVAKEDVDRDGQLYRAKDTAFENIYFDEGFAYRIYSEEDIGRMHIPRTSG